MGIDTKELKRPVQLLLADRSIRTEGQRRGTKYFAGGGGAKEDRSSKGAKRKTKRGGKRKSTKKAKAAPRPARSAQLGSPVARTCCGPTSGARGRNGPRAPTELPARRLPCHTHLP